MAMTKSTAQTGLTCCAVKTAHRLEFARVEVEEILRLSSHKAAASTAQRASPGGWRHRHVRHDLTD
jgi:hypothetical protein